MRTVRQNERGMALAVAIFALVVVGALVAGAFFIGTQEQRVGENQQRVGQALGTAEAAAPQIMSGWTPQSFNAMKVFPKDSLRVYGTMRIGSGSYGGYVWKLNRNVYLMDLTGADTTTRSGAALRRRGSGARQRIGVLARIRPLDIPSNASLTTQGNVMLAGTSSVDGNDHNPAGWTDCAPVDTGKAGIRTTPTGTVTTMGAATVSGQPPVTRDVSLDATDFTVFGDLTYNDLTRMANYVIPAGGSLRTEPVTIGGPGVNVCDKSVITNWGDGINHNAPCATHYPIVWIRGTGITSINNVQGQGILLVDGDLRVQGLYDYFGVVIIRGSLNTLGTTTSGAHFWGSVMAQNVNLSLETIGGASNLNYSKCAIVQALEYTGLTAFMRSRSYVGLY